MTQILHPLSLILFHFKHFQSYPVRPHFGVTWLGIVGCNGDHSQCFLYASPSQYVQNSQANRLTLYSFLYSCQRFLETCLSLYGPVWLHRCYRSYNIIRKNKICLSFAKKCLTNHKMKQKSLLNPSKETRFREKVMVDSFRKYRHMNSAIPCMQRFLNRYANKWLWYCYILCKTWNFVL